LSVNKNLGNTCTVLLSYKFRNLLQITQLKLVLIIKNKNEYKWDPMKMTSYTYAPPVPVAARSKA